MPVPRQPLTLAALAAAAAPVPDEDHFLLMVQEFLRGYGEAPTEQRPALTADAPALIAPHRNALIAALADHLAYVADRPYPRWCVQPERAHSGLWVTEPGGAVVVTELLRASPAAFWARGVLYHRDLLERAA